MGLVRTLLCAFHIAAVELQFFNLCRMHSVESMCIVCRGVASPDFTDNALLMAVHTLSRLFILVELFVGLQSLPPGVFDTIDWSLYIPHLV